MKSKTTLFILSIILFLSKPGYSQWCASLVDVKIGEHHTLVLDSMGGLWACGGGSGAAARGVGHAEELASLQSVLCGQADTFSGYLENVACFDAGWYHSLVVLSDGRCLSMGQDTNGQLGNGSEGGSNVPIFVHGLNNNPEGLRNIVKVSAGRSGKHSLAVDSNGYVYGWGYNSSKQCGGSSSAGQYLYPELVIDSDAQTTGVYLGDEAFIVDVEAGVSHSLGLERFEDGGFVYEWGGNAIPHKVPGTGGNVYLSNIIDIATCTYSLAADYPAGNVWYWQVGGNPQRIAGGQMGTTYLEDIVQVAAGNSIMAALDSHGNVWQWTSGSSPQKVTDGEQYTETGYLEDIIALDVGYYNQMIAIDSFGNGWSWGNNSNSSLGIGDQRSPSEPVGMLCAELHLLRLDKTDDVEDGQCVGLNDTFTYTIEWQNITAQTLYDVVVVDQLPFGVDVVSASPTGTYDPNSHSYTWQIADPIEPGDVSNVTITLSVNADAEPGSILHNVAELFSEGMLVAGGTENTDVCCWDDIEPDIIYVDITATGHNNGTCWQDAYNTLTDALHRAANSNCSDAFKIYVAEGTYPPTTNGYVLPDGMEIYGGFPSGGCSFKNRKPKKYETILTGLIDDDEFPDVDTLVEMGNNCLIDGCTITNAHEYCIHGNGVNFSVNHCIVQNSYDFGIYADRGNLNVAWCTIRNNGTTGIYHEGGNYELSVENSWLLRNGEYGLYTYKSKPVVMNSIISESSLVERASAGVRMYNPSERPVLQNCTIANNKAEGVYFDFDREDSEDPNNPKYPEIVNTILYFNNENGAQLKDLNPDLVASYCCIQDCNEVNNNYSNVPGFAYLAVSADPNIIGVPDPNNYHLASDAFCLDRGNPYLSYTGQADYDAETRVLGVSVDIGADEVNPECSEVSNELDFNTDGIINLYEFSRFARAWLAYEPNTPGITDPNDFENWDAECNVETSYSPYEINLYDLEVLADNWLWTACWRSECADSHNALDYNGDGLINMTEFALFSSVWESYLPGDAVWEFCNLDDTGDSEYTIDLADLVIFMEDWLWVSCTRADEFASAEPVASVPVVDPNQPEPSNLQKAINLNENICELNSIWESDPNLQQQTDPVEWQEFMNGLCNELGSLVNSLSEMELSIYNMVVEENCCESPLESMAVMSMSVQSQDSPDTKGVSLEEATKIAELTHSIELLEDIRAEHADVQQQISDAEWQEFMNSLYDSLDMLLESTE